MPAALRYSRDLWYRDAVGKLVLVTIQSNDRTGLDRIAKLYRKLEEESERKEVQWTSQHQTFTDAQIRDVRDTRVPPTETKRKGYPWEGPRYDFGYLLGEGAIWEGFEGNWRRGFTVSANLWEEGVLACDLMPRWVWDEKRKEWYKDFKRRRLRWVWDDEGEEVRCRHCGQYLDDLPMIAYCLGCDASGRDLAIPKGIPRRTKQHRPRTKKDDGLEGGMKGKP